MRLRVIQNIFTISVFFTIISCHGQSEKSLKSNRRTFVTEEFKVSFPKTKFEIEVKKNIATTSGEGYINLWTMKGADENGPFIFEIWQSPITIKRISEIQEVPNTLNVIYVGSMISLSSRLGGTDFISSESKIDGYSGMQATSKVFNGDGLLKSAIFRKGDFIYMISAGGKGVDLTSIDKFINSFQINK